MQREDEQLSSARDSQTKPGTIWIPIGLEGRVGLWANFLKKLCQFSKNLHPEHKPKKTSQDYFSMKLKGINLWGKIVPNLTRFTAWDSNSF